MKTHIKVIILSLGFIILCNPVPQRKYLEPLEPFTKLLSHMEVQLFLHMGNLPDKYICRNWKSKGV